VNEIARLEQELESLGGDMIFMRALNDFRFRQTDIYQKAMSLAQRITTLKRIAGPRRKVSILAHVRRGS
jgi:hypothetical protein